MLTGSGSAHAKTASYPQRQADWMLSRDADTVGCSMKHTDEGNMVADITENTSDQVSRAMSVNQQNPHVAKSHG